MPILYFVLVTLKNLRHFVLYEVSKAIFRGIVFNFPAYILPLKPSLVCQSWIFESLEPSLYPVKHLWIYSNKQNDDQVKFFPFPCLTEMGHSQIWRTLLDYRWKMDKIMRLWKYFAVQKSSFLRLFRKHLTSQK